MRTDSGSITRFITSPSGRASTATQAGARVTASPWAAMPSAVEMLSTTSTGVTRVPASKLRLGSHSRSSNARQRRWVPRTAWASKAMPLRGSVASRSASKRWYSADDSTSVKGNPASAIDGMLPGDDPLMLARALAKLPPKAT